MSCGCTTYECLNVIANDCDSITIELEATQTGNWVMQYEFNGKWFKQTIAVTDGDNIVLPAIFNENYTHTIKFYDNDNVELNDTCYALNTALIAEYGPSTAPIISNDIEYLAYIVVDGTPSTSLVPIGNLMGKEINAGTSITDSRLAGLLGTGLNLGGQIYTPDNFTKSKGATTLILLNDIETITGMVIILYTTS